MPSKKLLSKVGTKKSSKSKAGKASPAATAAAVTPEALIEQGNIALSKLEPELAMQFFQRASDMAPADTNIMDALAEVCLQLGDTEKAIALLTKSTTEAPGQNPFKWMYLAQLKTEEEALECYTRGISELAKALSESAGTDEERAVLRTQLAKAHCSVADLYLTDLCYADDAEQKCEAAITSALEVDSSSLDATQTLASLRLSQNRQADACCVMEGVYARCKAFRDRLHSRTVIQDLSGAADDEYAQEFDDIPDIDFFMTTTKLLIECGTPSLSAMALDLAADLLEDDDENVEIWYVAGVAAMNCEPVDLDSARYYISTAIAMMNEVRRYCEQEREPFPYDEEFGLLEEHMQMIGDAPEGDAEPDEGDMEVDNDI